ncbi:hypothetical protein [Anaeromicropila herbilytica]|uniref:Uncharacterized protein n=1 Tax=Anaeromicropila herbilytica TaxID=2785025 RepID=A0A7R7ENY3_9FIRM|nr:hypothetical protein [Anaeromicropila herbilytica]BCN32366.1 hypothetical protein bsdtb5_36610 [Anaeromicropila herbilytica]
MIYEYNYDNGIQIKIWDDEIPKQQLCVIKNISKRLDGNGICLEQNKTMAVELRLPRNISNYAMLGLVYENNTISTNIEIEINDYEEIEYVENIALKTDYIHMGIPEDYVNGIEKSINKLNNEELISNGNYKFCVGAHGEVGSSTISFMIVCSILLKLLLLENITKEKVREIIESEII